MPNLRLDWERWPLHRTSDLAGAKADASWTTRPRYGPWLVGTVGVFLLVLAGAIGLLAYWGLLGRPGAAGRGDALTALLALVGVVFTGALTTVGVLLRLSIDERSVAIREAAETRRSVEAERTAATTKQEQRRLQAETALRAVESLSDDVSQQQRGGALVALCSIGQVDLALSLLTDLWAEAMVRSAAAVRVIEHGLDHSEFIVQRESAELLRTNADKLLSPSGGLSWPRQFTDRWDADAEHEVKVSVVRAAIATWRHRPLADRDSSYANLYIVMFYEALRHETNDPLRVSVAAALDYALTAAHPRPQADDRIGTEYVVADIREETLQVLRSARGGAIVTPILLQLAELAPGHLERLAVEHRWLQGNNG